MNKTEAYQLLITEIENISQDPFEFYEHYSETEYHINKSSKSGQLYSNEIQVDKKGNNKYIFKGNIHDNNTSKFTLLEESLIVNLAS